MTNTKLVPFFQRKPIRAIAWVVVIGTLASGVIGGLSRGLDDDPDWSAFSRETRFAWERGETRPDTAMFGYLPTAVMALWPFTTWLPRPIGLIAFVAVHLAACLGAIALAYRHWFARPTSRGLQPARPTENKLRTALGLLLYPMFLYVAHLQHPMQANQFTLWVLVLCVAGLALLMRRRDLAGGLVLGLAACIKVTPLIFGLYLVLRRQWRAVAGMLLAIVLFDLIPSVAFFGVDGAIREHRMWLRRVEWYSVRRMIEDPNLRVLRHGNNCSYAIVLARWLRSPPPGTQQVVLRGDPPPHVVNETRASLAADEFLTLDPMTPASGEAWTVEHHDLSNLDRTPRFHVADWSADAVFVLWAATIALLLFAMALATYRSRLTLPGGPGWTAEVALWMLLMFWPSPMMRDYYLALALPAYFVVWRSALWPPPGTSRAFRGVMSAAIAIAYLSVFALASHAANWYGIHLATTAVLMIATAWTWRAERAAETEAQPDRLPVQLDPAPAVQP